VTENVKQTERLQSGLPAEAPEKLYYKNAQRIIPDLETE